MNRELSKLANDRAVSELELRLHDFDMDSEATMPNDDDAIAKLVAAGFTKSAAEKMLLAAKRDAKHTDEDRAEKRAEIVEAIAIAQLPGTMEALLNTKTVTDDPRFAKIIAATKTKRTFLVELDADTREFKVLKVARKNVGEVTAE